jgi:hypothetical protein
VPTDRTRFYDEYYAGFRLKTYYFKTKYNQSEMSGLCDSKQPGQLCPIFPGTFELGVGQNSAYTGGELRHWLLRTEAFYPLPFNPAFHVFFTAWIHLDGHNQNSAPLLLDSAASSVTATSPGVQVIHLTALDRDYYRIGLGVDLVQIIKKYATKPAAAAPAQPAPSK